jgi:hypothetical protein
MYVQPHDEHNNWNVFEEYDYIFLMWIFNLYVKGLISRPTGKYEEAGKRLTAQSHKSLIKIIFSNTFK